MNQRKPSARWVDRSIGEDIACLLSQLRLGVNLYGVRLSELRRSSGLGFWAPFLSILVHVSLLGSVMALVFNEPIQEFMPFFAVSFALWQGLSIHISESANSNERAAQLLSFPYISGFMIHFVNILEFYFALFFKFVAVLIVILAVNPSVIAGMNLASFLFGFALVGLLMFAWSLPISCLFDYFRILRGFLPQILFAVYLITPILWNPDRLREHLWVVNANPVYHVIEVVRAPLLQGNWPWSSIAVVVSLCVMGWIASMLAYKANRTLIVFRWIA